ncbi:hypothetical protein CDAR_194791 [Caerostris darwini]|uniref:Uncharacterized protein n=1 Tax=Caerostris darwini TaxID=1538125 RepID=A0AAV4X6F2_9ARAC|nr:hypothetical protein CDAR_194791 [Caerostris darwini]
MGLLRFVCSDTRTLNGLQLPEEGHLPLTRGSGCGRSGASRFCRICQSLDQKKIVDLRVMSKLRSEENSWPNQ